MQNSASYYLKGQFLMAMPGLTDPNFYQTVTCMCEHTRDGAVGVIINRVHETLTSADIFEELRIKCLPGKENLPIFLGGPVHIGEVFILHKAPFHWQGCIHITPYLAMSNTIDILQAIALDRGPSSFIITIGCAGWGPSQLEAEIKENVWMTSPIDEDILFHATVETRWEESLKKLGINPTLLSDSFGHA